MEWLVVVFFFWVAHWKPRSRWNVRSLFCRWQWSSVVRNDIVSCRWFFFVIRAPVWSFLHPVLFNNNGLWRRLCVYACRSTNAKRPTTHKKKGGTRTRHSFATWPQPQKGQGWHFSDCTTTESNKTTALAVRKHISSTRNWSWCLVCSCLFSFTKSGACSQNNAVAHVEQKQFCQKFPHSTTRIQGKVCNVLLLSQVNKSQVWIICPQLEELLQFWQLHMRMMRTKDIFEWFDALSAEEMQSHTDNVLRGHCCCFPWSGPHGQ